MVKFQLAVLLLMLTNEKVFGECYGNGFAEENITIIEGISGTCIAVVRNDETRIGAEKKCKEKFFHGKLLAENNMDQFKKSAFAGYLGLLEHYEWWIGYRDDQNSCWVIGVSGKRRRDCRTRKYFYACQYPFQYNCAYKTAYSNMTITGYISATNVRKCEATVYTYWQRSDANHKKNCTRKETDVIVYDDETQKDFCNCVNIRGWLPWSEWSSCTSSCGEDQQGIMYRYRGTSCTEHWRQREESTCNTHISCQKTTTLKATSRKTSSKRTFLPRTGSTTDFDMPTQSIVKNEETETSTSKSDFKLAAAIIVATSLVALGIVFVISGILFCFARKKSVKSRKRPLGTLAVPRYRKSNSDKSIAVSNRSSKLTSHTSKLTSQKSSRSSRKERR